MTWSGAWLILEWLVRIVMVPVILRRRMSPAPALAYLVVIAFVPVIGAIVYWLIGVRHLGRRRAAWHRRVIGRSRSDARIAEMKTHLVEPPATPELRSMVTHAERISGNPVVAGNAVELLSETPNFISRLIDDIHAATDHVHILMYIFWPDDEGRRVVDALVDAAGRGVTCRVLVDSAGSRSLWGSDAVEHLQDAGVQLKSALPVMPFRRKLARFDVRNHRKIAVVDGRIGYAGSHNIVRSDYGDRRAGAWQDLSARFTGPVVAQLQMLFLDDWAFETGDDLDEPDLFPSLERVGEIAAQVVPTGPSHEADTFQRVLVAALNAAQQRIVITTPYFVLDEPTYVAVAMAADRGVNVTLIMPEKSDHPIVDYAARFYFVPLMEAGVDIHLYQQGMLHAKTITVDDAFSLLGSANIDIRSFELNFEVSMLLYGPEVTHVLRFAQQRYLAQARPVSLHEWKRRPIYQRYAESAAALASPLL